MKVVFLGTPEWAVPSLKAVAASRHALVGIVSQPDRRRERSGAPVPPPVVLAARGLGSEAASGDERSGLDPQAAPAARGAIPLRQPESAREPAFLDWFRSLGADAGVLVAYGEILSRELLAIPPRGFMNLHFSLLPRWRGAAPVQWAIASGDTRTGVTTQQVVARLDAGDVLMQRAVDIGPRETAAQLGTRLATLGSRVLVETLDGLESGALVPHPQDESAATRAPMLTREDGIADWGLPAPALARRIRAFDPWPGVATSARGRPLRLLEAVAEPAGSAAVGALPAGTVLGLAGSDLRIMSGDGTILRVERMQFAGGRRITGLEAVNGRLVAPGDRLGETE